MDADTQSTLEDIAEYHRAIAERCRKEAVKDIINCTEQHALPGAARMHQSWADAVASILGQPSPDEL